MDYTQYGLRLTGRPAPIRMSRAEAEAIAAACTSATVVARTHQHARGVTGTRLTWTPWTPVEHPPPAAAPALAAGALPRRARHPRRPAATMAGGVAGERGSEPGVSR